MLAGLIAVSQKLLLRDTLRTTRAYISWMAKFQIYNGFPMCRDSKLQKARRALLRNPTNQGAYRSTAYSTLGTFVASFWHPCQGISRGLETADPHGAEKAFDTECEEIWQCFAAREASKRKFRHVGEIAATCFLFTNQMYEKSYIHYK